MSKQPEFNDASAAVAILAHLRKPETVRNFANKAHDLAAVVGVSHGSDRDLDRVLQLMKRDGAIEYVKGHGWKAVPQ